MNDHLPMFQKYLDEYKKLLEWETPDGEDTTVYKEFDTYMKKLDPILGYMTSRFGKENADRMMDEFFFSYADENSR